MFSTHSMKYIWAAPVAEWLRSLTSVLLIIRSSHRCGFAPRTGHESHVGQAKFCLRVCQVVFPRVLRFPLHLPIYITCSAWAINASCQVSLKSVHRFWRRRFLKCFYYIWAWRPSWSCDLDFLYIHWSPLPIDALYKIWLWLAKRFREEDL